MCALKESDKSPLNLAVVGAVKALPTGCKKGPEGSESGGNAMDEDEEGEDEDQTWWRNPMFLGSAGRKGRGELL